MRGLYGCGSVGVCGFGDSLGCGLLLFRGVGVMDGISSRKV